MIITKLCNENFPDTEGKRCIKIDCFLGYLILEYPSSEPSGRSHTEVVKAVYSFVGEYHINTQ